MSNKNIRVSPLSSSVNELRRSKRLKTDTLNLSSSGNDSILEPDNMKRKLLIKLSRFDAAAAQRKEVSNRIQKLLEDRENLLAMQRETDTQTIKQLRKELERSMESIEKARAAQVAAESEISQIKKKNAELSMENAKLKNNVIASHSRATSSLSAQNNTSAQAKRRSLEVKANRVDELEKELQTARGTISSLGEEVKGKRRLEKKMFDLQKKMDNAENQRQLMEKLEKECQNLASKVKTYLDSEYEISDHMEKEDVLMNQNDSVPQPNNSGNPPAQATEQISPQDCVSGGKEQGPWQEVRPGVYRGPNDDFAVRSGLHTFVRPSSRLFAELNWNDEYSHDVPGLWECKKCYVVSERSSRMEDHVWTVHYGGSFECRHCSPGSTVFQSRVSVRSHNKVKHPELVRLEGSPALTKL